MWPVKTKSVINESSGMLSPYFLFLSAASVSLITITDGRNKREDHLGIRIFILEIFWWRNKDPCLATVHLAKEYQPI